LEVSSPTIESNNQIVVMNEADKNPHGIDNNNLHGIEVLPTFLTITNGI
jgi:hypothetical protein